MGIKLRSPIKTTLLNDNMRASSWVNHAPSACAGANQIKVFLEMTRTNLFCLGNKTIKTIGSQKQCPSTVKRVLEIYIVLNLEIPQRLSRRAMYSITCFFYQIGLIDLKQTKKRERFGVVSDFRYFWLKVFASWQFVFRNT